MSDPTPRPPLDEALRRLLVLCVHSCDASFRFAAADVLAGLGIAWSPEADQRAAYDEHIAEAMDGLRDWHVTASVSLEPGAIRLPGLPSS